ncbi:MAG TPA: Stp1/IreP family PP2C-type Ser/Thr phosphatase [Gemmatimonadales bacterium]|nr:Stp1/IreP family PP2C-type Ser/Thr phosphatase [Gemmatimonadales bacterium]
MNSGPVRVSVFGKTDLGRTRDHNEDTFLVADLSTRSASLQPEVRDHVIGPRGSLFMVADGMGGAAAGEIASRMATDAIYQYLTREWTTDPDVSEDRFAERVRLAVEQANRQIYEFAREHAEVRGMGTTATVAGVYGSNLFLAQIGDSRAYLDRNGEVIQLTKDQSLMQRLVDAGELTEEEAEQSERRNIILQALGPDPRVKVDLTWQPLRRGDVLVLCSDGLSGLVRREEIAGVLAEEPDLARACSRLIDLANERGGPDNITVVLARFDGEGLAPAGGEPGDVAYRAYRPSGEAPTIDMAAITAPMPAITLPPLSAVPLRPAEPAPAPAVDDPPLDPIDEAVAPEPSVAGRRAPNPTLITIGVSLLAALLYYLLSRR